MRGQRKSGSEINRTFAGFVIPSFNSTPLRSLSKSVSSGIPSTCTKYVFSVLNLGSAKRCCTSPLFVKISNPSLSRSNRPAAYTLGMVIKSFNVARPFSSVNCVSTSKGLLNKITIVCSNVSGFALGLNERVGFTVRLVVNEREEKDFDILFIQ